MAHDIIMPALGMAQETGIITAWKKQPGDAVKASDIVMEIETDKSTVELTSPWTGTVHAIHVEVGAYVEVGNPVLEIALAAGAEVEEEAT